MPHARLYKHLRKASFYALKPLDASTRRSVDRWLRASQELTRLDRADGVVVSYPKSGRTWLRAFLAAYFQRALALGTDQLFGFDNYFALDRRAPRILFTHDDSFDARLDERRLLPLLRRHRPLLLARDPRDTVVSNYFQNRFRMAPQRRELYALDRPDIAEIDGFVMDEELGLARILAFYARWARRRPLMPPLPIVRYEDLKRDPPAGFTRLLAALGVEPDPAVVARAVDATGFERMREKERAGALAGEGGRFSTGDRGRPEAFKVRAGLVGGYRQILAPETIAWMEQRMAEHMPHGFGYRADERAPSVF